MKTIKSAILVLLVSTIFILGMGTRVMAAEGNLQGVISVNGEGIINLKPDLCEINFSTIITNDDQVKAVEENAKKMDNLISSFKQWGIKEDDIKTESIYVGPVYDYEKQPATIKNYRSENIIVVTVRDMNKIGEAIDHGIKSGASSVGYLRYGSSNSEEAYNEALKLAVKNAKGKAEAISNALGVKIKNVIKVEEISGNYYTRALSKEVSMDAGAESSSIPTPVEVQDLEVKGGVKVDYKY